MKDNCQHTHTPYRAAFGMPCTGPRVCFACGKVFSDAEYAELERKRARERAIKRVSVGSSVIGTQN